jgi:hypothetical protein
MAYCYLHYRKQKPEPIDSPLTLWPIASLLPPGEVKLSHLHIISSFYGAYGSRILTIHPQPMHVNAEVIWYAHGENFEYKNKRLTNNLASIFKQYTQG